MNRYDWLTALNGLLQDIRTLHRPDQANYCRECTRDWPCKTFRLANMQPPRED